jgi:sulfatase maturation enzyme AslB (radical SAM superfamily)
LHENAVEELLFAANCPKGLNQSNWEWLRQEFYLKSLRDIFPLFGKTELTAAEHQQLERARDSLVEIRALADWPPNILSSIDKLDTILKIMLDFFEGKLEPEVLAPFRQIQLISICNARCIHCPGLYTEEISQGAVVNEKRVGAMPEQAIEKALADPQHITDFFMNGSEFLLYRKWVQVARRLRDGGLRLSMSTNGMLLTKSNVDLLIENDFIGCLNVSLDGAHKDTIQNIRARVNFDTLRANVEYVFTKASASCNSNFNINFSFVLMTLNYNELPELYPLVASLRAGLPKPHASILIQALDAYETPGYKEFRLKHHHRNIPKTRLIEVFDRVREQSVKYEIPTSVFYRWDINEFRPTRFFN